MTCVFSDLMRVIRWWGGFWRLDTVFSQCSHVVWLVQEVCYDIFSFFLCWDLLVSNLSMLCKSSLLLFMVMQEDVGFRGWGRLYMTERSVSNICLLTRFITGVWDVCGVTWRVGHVDIEAIGFEYFSLDFFYSSLVYFYSSNANTRIFSIIFRVDAYVGLFSILQLRSKFSWLLEKVTPESHRASIHTTFDRLRCYTDGRPTRTIHPYKKPFQRSNSNPGELNRNKCNT